MNKEKLQDLFSDPGKIEAQDLIQLQQLVKDYPFFQNAHFLLLFGMHQHHPDKYNEQLRQSSLFLSSRKELVNTIIYGWSAETKVENNKPAVLDVVAEELPVLLEKELEIQALSLKEETTTEIIPAKEFAFEEAFSFSFEDTSSTEAVDKREDDTLEKQDFSPDLLEFDLTSAKYEEPEPVDLIDHFLKVNPRIVPKLELDDRGDISTPGLEENDEIVTEILAEIYERQGHFLKSKEAYQKLILKFPEKSTYFASRIQELEKRIK